MAQGQTIRLLDQEAQALQARLRRIETFGAYVPMVEAAQPQRRAQAQLDRFIAQGRVRIERLIAGFIDWLQGPAGHTASDAEAQRRYSFMKLRFTALMTQFDLFADVWTQRSEHEVGIWLAGLDRLASDALDLPAAPYARPPLICYLDRGVGAAIRRARTRLPGGGDNPVSIIRVPRERLIGAGIASSLIHEVGHQGAALLDLVPSLRAELAARADENRNRSAWLLWSRWISEIIADFWSIAHLGITSTMGLIGVVSLPRAFVFRISRTDPHPAPWIRVRLSAAIGQALFPDAQWQQLTAMWERLYPPDNNPERANLIASLDATRDELVERILRHRPPKLNGRPLASIFPAGDRQPDELRARIELVLRQPDKLPFLPPSLAMALIGQARAEHRLSAELEARRIETLLREIALAS